MRWGLPDPNGSLFGTEMALEYTEITWSSLWDCSVLEKASGVARVIPQSFRDNNSAFEFALAHQQSSLLPWKMPESGATSLEFLHRLSRRVSHVLCCHILYCLSNA